MALDKELLQKVRSKFQLIEEKMEGNPTSDDLLEIAAALRYLLIDGGNGNFKRAWDSLKSEVDNMPKQPAINGIILNRLKGIPSIAEGKSIILASNVRMPDGVGIGTMMMISGNLADEEQSKLTESIEPVNVYLHHYIDSICMIIGNYLVSRRDVIKYLANKKGGVHYDTSRNIEIKEVDGEHYRVIDENFIFAVLDEAFDFDGNHPSPHNIRMYFGENGNGLHAVLLGICHDLLTNTFDVGWFIATAYDFVGGTKRLGFK